MQSTSTVLDWFRVLFFFLLLLILTFFFGLFPPRRSVNRDRSILAYGWKCQVNDEAHVDSIRSWNMSTHRLLHQLPSKFHLLPSLILKRKSKPPSREDNQNAYRALQVSPLPRQIYLHINCRCQNHIRHVNINQISYKQQCFAIRLLRLHLHFLSMQTSLLCTIGDKHICHWKRFSSFLSQYSRLPNVNQLTGPPWLVHRPFPKCCIPTYGISSSIHTPPSFQAGIHWWLRPAHLSPAY